MDIWKRSGGNGVSKRSSQPAAGAAQMLCCPSPAAVVGESGHSHSPAGAGGRVCGQHYPPSTSPRVGSRCRMGRVGRGVCMCLQRVSLGLFLSSFHVVTGISALDFFIPHQEATEKLNQSSVLQTGSHASVGRAALSGLSAMQALGRQPG